MLNKFDDIGAENEELAEKKQKEKKESAEEETLQSETTLNIFHTITFSVKKRLFTSRLALSQVDFKHANLGSTTEQVFVTQTFKELVGKLTDHAVGDSIVLHALAQALYQPEVRVEHTQIGITSTDEYKCNDESQEHRFCNFIIKYLFSN